MNDSRRVLVIAGNYREAVRWAEEQGLARDAWKYVHDVHDLAGRSSAAWRVQWVGYAWLRDDFRELRAVADRIALGMEPTTVEIRTWAGRLVRRITV